MIREANAGDLSGLLQLYTWLHDNPIPEDSPSLAALWERILRDPDHHIVLAEEEGRPVSSCVCVIIPNLTHAQRPYALIENVVTDPVWRGKGLATACLNYAREIARAAGCYKLMLSTGSKREETLRFYRNAGYNSEDKTGFVQWL